MKIGLTLLLAAVPTLAAAQESQPATDQAAATPTIVTDDEGPIPDPNVPDIARRRPPSGPGTPVVRYTKADYPTEIVKRPLTLAAMQGQVTLDMPLVAGDGHPTLTQILRGAFGVTQDLEVGVSYSVGLERLSPDSGTDGFEAGKAFSLDGAYTLVPQLLSCQARLAFLADSDNFGVGLILGVPLKLELGDRWALFGGQDLVHIKLKALPVDPADPAGNLAQLAAITRGVPTSRGSIDVHVGAAFQATPVLALYGIFGVAWPDFSGDQQPWSLFAGLTYTADRVWDIGARVGFYKLDQPSESFSVGATAALRI
jgi:hypothetical protein